MKLKQLLEVTNLFNGQAIEIKDTFGNIYRYNDKSEALSDKALDKSGTVLNVMGNDNGLWIYIRW